jgi:hypothetical protein
VKVTVNETHTVICNALLSSALTEMTAVHRLQHSTRKLEGTVAVQLMLHYTIRVHTRYAIVANIDG